MSFNPIFFYEQGKIRLNSMLVAYYKFQGNANDSVGSNNGTSTNVTYNSSNGIIGQGAGFNGTTSNILVNDSTSFTLSSANFSISLWFKRNVSGVRLFMAGQTDGGGSTISTSFSLQVQANNKVRGNVVNGSTVNSVDSSSTINTGWNHLILMRTGTELSLWINGVKESTLTIGTITINDSASNVGIGQVGELTFDRLNGAIDEFGFWKRNLTNAEVAYLYNSGSGRTYPFN